MGFIIPNIVDASAKVSKHSQIDKGVFIGKHVVVNAGAVIGQGALSIPVPLLNMTAKSVNLCI